MRRIKATTLVVALSAAAAVSGRADTSSEARRAIQSAYNHMDAALVKHDIAAMFSCVAPNAEFVDKVGTKRSATVYKSWMEGNVKFLHQLVDSTKVESVSVKGGEATVGAKEHRSMAMSNMRTGETFAVEYVMTYHDTWVRGGKGWKLQKSVLLTQQQLVNGVPR